MNALPGTAAAEFFQPYEDIIYEIGLTPNRMDAMSHLGVAKDVCAYLSHHQQQSLQAVAPFNNDLSIDNYDRPVSVSIENTAACQRYSGISIEGVALQSRQNGL
jgi:phenylalanyl-tRNA synthetase beta chain